VDWYQKGKPIWILLKQETVSGSGISWAVCKSAPRSRQIATPAPHHSVFYRPSCRPTNSVKALKAIIVPNRLFFGYIVEVTAPASCSSQQNRVYNMHCIRVLSQLRLMKFVTLHCSHLLHVLRNAIKGTHGSLGLC